MKNYLNSAVLAATTALAAIVPVKTVNAQAHSANTEPVPVITQRHTANTNTPSAYDATKEFTKNADSATSAGSEKAPAYGTMEGTAGEASYHSTRHKNITIHFSYSGLTEEQVKFVEESLRNMFRNEELTGGNPKEIALVLQDKDRGFQSMYFSIYVAGGNELSTGDADIIIAKVSNLTKELDKDVQRLAELSLER